MEEQYINLSVESNSNKNNWFLLQQKIPTKLEPFSIETFKIEVERQLNDPNKLETIELTFGKHYPNYKIELVDFNIDDAKFEKMIKLSENEKNHPMLTFHGTSITSVRSILNEGYKVPTTRSAKVKNNITIKNGAMYGYGVYTSPFFDKAMYYTVPENEHYVYLIVNFLVLGKIKLIPPIPSQLQNNSDTNIVFGLEQIISSDPNLVIPIAILTIKIK